MLACEMLAVTEQVWLGACYLGREAVRIAPLKRPEAVAVLLKKWVARRRSSLTLQSQL